MSEQRLFHDHRHELGQQLLMLRTRAALTQSALAAELGVHRRSVQNWENGISYPKAEMLHRLIAVFLHHNVWTPGQERAEAQALWSQAVQEGPHALPAFDQAWLAALRAHAAGPVPGDHGSAREDQGLGAGGRGDSKSPTIKPQRPPPSPSRPVIDWGEAPAIPTLHGRARELATLQQWIVADRCRVVALIGIGGMGKSSLAMTAAQSAGSQFEVVLFRSLQNGRPPAEVLDQIIRAVSEQHALPHHVPDKIALLVQLLRERRCLLILDNFEAVLQPGALTGTYRAGYAEYGALLQALSERAHQSCLVLTSREKPAELSLREGRRAPVRTLLLAGLDEAACRIILASKDIDGLPDHLDALARLYGGNPLALQLVAAPIRELFGGDVAAFLAAGDAFFSGLVTLMEQQCARTTPQEHAVLYWLAIERELVPVDVVLARVGDAVPQREVLQALESLRRRVQIERAPDRPAFTLQPVILEFVTSQFVGFVCQEIVSGQPDLLRSHALVQATAKEYIRHSQERLIATPLLERLIAAAGDARSAELRLLELLDAWRDQPPATQGYGPGNLINLLWLLRDNLNGLDLGRLSIKQAYLQGALMQGARLAGASIQDSVFTEIFDAILWVAISHDGLYWAASTRGGEVVVWEAGGHAVHRYWRAHADMIWNLAFSPDGRWLATAGWDGTVKLWEIASGALRWSGRHTSHVNSVAFAPDGSMLASGANDATVRLWDTHTGAQLQVLLHPGPVSGAGVGWSSDGRWIASGDSAGTIRLWAIHPTEPATCVQTIAAHTSMVDGLAFSPDGASLASASWDGTVKLWAVAEARLIQELAGHTGRVGRVAWAHDGRTLAVSGYDPTIWLWDVEQGRYGATLQGHTDGVCGLVFTPDNGGLLSCGNGTLRVWDIATGECTRVIQGYEDFLYVVDWSPDGRQLASGGMDGLVMIWDAAGAAVPRALRGHRGNVCGVAWSSDGRWLASSEWENTIRLWDPASGVCRQVIQHPDDPGNFFYGLAWSPDGQRLAGGTSRRGLLVWDVAAQRPHWLGQPLPTFIRHVAWHPNGAQLAGAGDDGTLYVWDARDGRLLQQLTGHHSMITSLAWSPDGAQLVSGGRGIRSGELFVWNIERGERVDTLAGHAGIVYALAWGALANVLISGDGDGVLRWWDVRSGECLWARDAHRGTVQSLRRSPDGTTLASCGDDGTIMLWDLRTGEPAQTLRRDRPYERLDITGIQGITESQQATLLALGAVSDDSAQSVAASDPPPLITSLQPPSSSDDDSVLLAGIPHLPVQPTAFIGRSSEIAAIAGQLGDPACRLLTLLGPGGIGKTRLALEVAANHADTFTDGVAFVALASVETSPQIVSAIGDALGLAFAGQPDPAARLLGYLHDRRMLLILDTFEHLLASIDLVAELLAGAPQLTILVTSRARLNLQVEWLFDIEGLAYPPQSSDALATAPDPVDLAHYSAIQLFIQRATQVQPELTFPETTIRAIVRICQHIAGMPLAIELAAAGVRGRPIPVIEQQIRANLDVLASSLRDVPARHRSLRAVFDDSWNLLGAPERRYFSRLAVFRGGWTVEAAVAVCEVRDPGNNPQQRDAPATQSPMPYDLLPILAALVDTSLVRQDRAAMPRFHMLESIREYALEQLVARGEAVAAQRAHASYYLALAEAAAEHWDTPAGEAEIAQLDREHDNLRAALQWARDGGDRTLGLQLAGSLTKFWQRRGHVSEGRVWLADMLAADADPAHANATPARLRALEGASRLAAHQYDFVQATQLFEQSVAVRRALGQPEDATQLLGTAAIAARVAGEYARAIGLLEDTLLRQRALGDRGSLSSGGIGLSLVLLAVMRREQGDFVSAGALYEECLALHRALEDREGISISLLGLGDIARDQGDIAQMRLYANESLALVRELQVQWAVGVVLNILALAAYLEGDLPRASAICSESVALLRAQHADGTLAEVLITFGRIAQAQGDVAAAYAALTEALRRASTVGPRLMVAAALEELAALVIAHGRGQLATRRLAAAAALRAQMGTPVRPVDRPIVDRARATARAILGEAAFEATWAAALALPLEQLLDTIRNEVYANANMD